MVLTEPHCGHSTESPLKGPEVPLDIELLAIGIGHDVSRYYTRAVTIKDVDELSSTMFKELADVFEKMPAMTNL